MRSLFKKIVLPFALVILGTLSALADGPKPPSSLSNPFVTLLAIIIVLLAVVIGVLAKLVIGSAFLKLQKEKSDKGNSKGIATLLTLFFVGLSMNLFAQDKAVSDSTAAVADKAFASGLAGVSETAYYLLGSVVILEVIIIAALLLMLKAFLAVEKKAVEVEATAAVPAKPQYDWWEKINSFKPIHQEADIDLGHNYDGIRELDNRLPPWWLYGFYICIVFAVIYLYRYHVAQSAPLSKQEYEIAVAQGEAEKAAYLEKAANNVDENTVKLITDKDQLAAAKQIFTTVCAACHTATGAGNVGPNLTDDYWLHGGSIKDVFKTIKYGWPDKGMKSWKDDYSPVQIAQLASYVKSLHGTNPPNPKAPQGTLYVEETGGKAAADSTKKDSSTSMKK